MIRHALACAMLVVLGFASGAKTEEAEFPLDPAVEYALAAVPGGTALGSRHAVWPDGMELTVPDPMLRAVGACPTNRVCAFGGTGLGGAMLSWNTCATHSTAALPAVGSVANARSIGILQARNGTTVVTTAVAGTWKNVYSVITNVHCINVT